MKYICDSCEKYPCDDNAIKLMKYCPVYSPKPKPQTNADRIRAMTDEELAEAICKVELMSGKHGHRGFQAWLDWLKQEEDDAT